MINCKDAVGRLWAYLDRNLERAKEDELEQHLGLCRHCCGELEFAKQVRTRLAEGGQAVDPAVRRRLLGFARSLEERR